VGIPVAIAVSLPLALARFSLLAAGLSLVVSALLLLLAVLAYAETVRQFPPLRPVEAWSVEAQPVESTDEAEGQVAA
jgi:uncharacterized protein (DUF58 family)